MQSNGCARLVKLLWKPEKNPNNESLKLEMKQLNNSKQSILSINACDVCVIPKKPLKLYEYMVCGKPVVASDIKSVKDLL